MAVAEVEPVFERGGEVGELTAAGDDIEIQVTVAVRIEEGGAEVLGDRVRREQPLIGRDERAVGALHEERAGLSFRATDEEVV